MDQTNYVVHIILEQCFRTVLLADLSWLPKITKDSSILAHVEIECPDGRYPKLNIYI